MSHERSKSNDPNNAFLDELDKLGLFPFNARSANRELFDRMIVDDEYLIHGVLKFVEFHNTDRRFNFGNRCSLNTLYTMCLQTPDITNNIAQYNDSDKARLNAALLRALRKIIKDELANVIRGSGIDSQLELTDMVENMPCTASKNTKHPGNRPLTRLT